MDRDWILVWSDEFDGNEVDRDKWNLIKGSGGFGNNEHQHYTVRPENVQVRNSCLVITARKEDYETDYYTSAKLTSQGKAFWTYGRVEVRAKFPVGRGVWPALWMMPEEYSDHGESIYGRWPACGEIDLAEILGHIPGRVYGTLHYGFPHTYTSSFFELEPGQTFHDDFHLFALEWEAGEIRWYVDGKYYQTQKDWFSWKSADNPENPFPAPFDRPFYFIINLAVGGKWPGYPDETTVFPQEFIVDYVRVYRKSENA